MVKRERKISTMAVMAAGSYAVAVLEAALQWEWQQPSQGRTGYREERGTYTVRSWSRQCHRFA